MPIRRMMAVSFFVALTALCGCASAQNGDDGCDAAGISNAVTNEQRSSDSPKTKASQFEDLAAQTLSCEARSSTAASDPNDPLNLALAQVHLQAAIAYAAAGDKQDAEEHAGTAAEVAQLLQQAKDPNVVAQARDIAAQVKTIR